MSEGYNTRGKVDYGWWIKQLQDGSEYRKHAAFEDSWNKWHAFYRGDWTADVPIPVNLFFTLMRTIVPRVYFRDPSVSITSSKPGPLFMGFAKLLERVDSKLIRQMRLKTELKSMVQDAFLYGTGIGTLGFGALYEYSHLGHVGAPSVGKDGELIEYRDHVIPHMPWFSRIHPRNYIVPADTMSKQNMRWTAHIVERTVEDVQKDPRLNRSARRSVQAGRFWTDNVGMNPRRAWQQHAMEPTTVELAVIRDKKTRQVIVLSPGADSILFQGDDALQGHGFPEFVVTFNDDPEYFWGVPDSQILEPFQHELNETRTQIMAHRRMSMRKLLVKRGAINKSEVENLVNGSVGAVVWTEERPDISVNPIQTADVPQGLFANMEAVLRDVRETVGFSRNQMGEFNSRTADTTATEAQIVRAASEIRIDERRDMMAETLVDIVEGMHDMIFNHWSTEEVVEVVGPGGAPVWVRFTPQMLKLGQYNVKIDPDDNLPVTRDIRQQRAIELYGILRTNPIVDPYKLTQYLLNELRGSAFDDMMRALPQMGAGQTLNGVQYGEMLQQAIGQGDPQRILQAATGQGDPA